MVSSLTPMMCDSTHSSTPGNAILAIFAFKLDTFLVSRPIPGFSMFSVCNIEKLGEPGDEAILVH